jgi:hypothetical protein
LIIQGRLARGRSLIVSASSDNFPACRHMHHLFI